MIKAVDEYQDLLRISVASAGNDHRLGANEAPPAVVSMFLGEELTDVLKSIEEGTAYDAKEKTLMRIGVHVLPKFPKDTTDRNRTSPFAFTGNKFEFRMLGSSASVADANVVLNTAVAESLRQFADILENAEDFMKALNVLILDTIKKHKRIIFNGNGYDESWIKEATEVRGLLNLKSTPECLPYYLHKKNVDLFTTHKVFSETEMKARYEVKLENYCKTINIEALTMVDMVNKDVLPAITAYVKDLSETVAMKKSAVSSADCSYEEKVIAKLSSLTGSIFSKVKALETALIEVKNAEDSQAAANMFKDSVFEKMQSLRADCDEAESITASKYWPYPTYGELLFSVR